MNSAVLPLLYAVALAVSPGRPAVAGSMPAIPHEQLLKEAVRAANQPGKAIVERFVLADRSHWVRDSLYLLPGDIRIVETKRMSAAWRRKLARLLLRDSLFTGLATLDPAEAGPHVAVRFDEPVGALEIRMYLACRRAQVILGGSPLGIVKLRSVAEEALSLVREVYPGDTAWIALPPAVPPRYWGEEFLYVDTAGVTLPEAIGRVPPVYPPVAVAHGISGTVWIRALIAESGRVSDAYVLRSIPALDVAAIEAIRQWSFAPARRDGAPQRAWVQIPVTFTLR